MLWTKKYRTGAAVRPPTYCNRPRLHRCFLQRWADSIPIFVEMEGMKKIICAFALALVLLSGCDLRCELGFSTCIATQGKKIRSDVVVEMLDDCEKFTRHNAGARAIKLSTSEVSDEYERNGINAPVVQAYYALDRLKSSPLVFYKEWERMDYVEIRRSCGILHRDFYDNSKRIRD